MEDKVLDYGDVLLRRQDALLLLGPHWLNDQVIAFYFEYLTREAFPRQPGLLLIPGSAAFLLATLGPDGGGAQVVLSPLGFPLTAKLALFAVNDNPDVHEAGGGSHWSLLAWNAADGSFRHYDSAAGGNLGAALRVAAAAAAELPRGSKGLSLSEQRTPPQRNAHDCGVYVLAIARLLCQRFAAEGSSMSWEVTAEEVSPAGVAALRREVYRLILDRAAQAGIAGGLPPLES